MRKVLIANRGEIARRIIRSAHRMGLETVAVYSEADANAPHVREATQAVLIGPAPAAESYLRVDKLLEAARRTGADAVHPGYGFLSENADFADAVREAGLIFVGPPTQAIRVMGLKDAAKKAMKTAGVPVTPGYQGEDQSLIRLERAAQAIGYPLLIKAVAGGGGKGMRRVDNEKEFGDALLAAKREADRAFGNDGVMIEKLIGRPRHVEVQVFADRHGNVVHLFERDCSLQRRHQKVIEEAPAPGMDQATREAICAAAVKAAKAVDYVGAGTIEFIADASEGLRADRIWFMEMNTRLQVEHPVTEEITGQDLVEWQLRVASGEPLPLRQDELAIRGWAMEARLYAEDPAHEFLPSTGRLDHFVMPRGLRIDTGVEEGDRISPYYDPMIAKVIASGRTRDEAAERLAEALTEVEVWPVRTNAGFLALAAADPDFRAGEVETSFIPARLDRLVPDPAPSEGVWNLAATAFLGSDFGNGSEEADAWSALQGFRLNGSPDPSVAIAHRGEVRIVEPGAGPLEGIATAEGEQVLVFASGLAFAFTLPGYGGAGAGGGEGEGSLVSPMPGRVISVEVRQGDQVAKGQKLLTLEAMKMEHSLAAPFDGIVAELNASAGSQVTEGTLLVRVEKGDD